jgi:hypothetical protein
MGRWIGIIFLIGLVLVIFEEIIIKIIVKYPFHSIAIGVSTILVFYGIGRTLRANRRKLRSELIKSNNYFLIQDFVKQHGSTSDEEAKSELLAILKKKGFDIGNVGLDALIAEALEEEEKTERRQYMKKEK